MDRYAYLSLEKKKERVLKASIGILPPPPPPPPPFSSPCFPNAAVDKTSKQKKGSAAVAVSRCRETETEGRRERSCSLALDSSSSTALHDSPLNSLYVCLNQYMCQSIAVPIVSIRPSFLPFPRPKASGSTPIDVRPSSRICYVCGWVGVYIICASTSPPQPPLRPPPPFSFVNDE